MLAGLVLASVVACECARLPDGTDFRCEPDGGCPPGLVCVSPEMICREPSAEDACVQATCQPGECGPRPDGCGDTVECGACTLPLFCGAVEPGRCGCASNDGGGSGAPEAACRDSLDNDCDGLTDCADDNCNGASCDDRNACTSGERCVAGGCDGGTPLICPPPTEVCRASGQCNPTTGACTYPLLSAGSPCSDSNACTTGDSCDMAGICGGSPVTCNSPPNGQCYLTPGTCDAGDCTYIRSAAGSGCNDGDLCTTNDTCDGAGTCQPGPPQNCPPGGECDMPTCDPTTGTCGLASAPSGKRCPSQDRNCFGSVCCTIGRCNGLGVCFPETANEGIRCADDGTMCGGVPKQCRTCQSGSCVLNIPSYNAACLPLCSEVDSLCPGSYTCRVGLTCEASYDCGTICCQP